MTALPEIPLATRYPGVGVRAVATIIDGILGGLLIGVPLVVAFGKHETTQSASGAKVASYSTSSPWVFALWIVLAIAYYVVFESLVGATPGKLILGLRVRGLDGERPSWRAACIRNALRIADAFPYVVPYLVGAVAIWTGAVVPQRLGDRVAKTVVTHR